MEAVTRRRVLTCVLISLAAYAATFVLLGLAASSAHAAARWLSAGAMMAIAIGLGSTVAWRITWFVLDPESRVGWWTQAPWPARILRSFSLAIRAAAALLIAGIAVRSLA